MGRKPCCDKHGVKRGAWTPEEDEILIDYIKKNGHRRWRSLPKHAGFSFFLSFFLSFFFFHVVYWLCLVGEKREAKCKIYEAQPNEGFQPLSRVLSKVFDFPSIV